MREELQRIIELQPVWSHKKTPEMDERGKLVRNEGPEWLEIFASELAAELGIREEELIFEGRDGTGQKTEVPWFRFANESLSPSATIGWYCVYLFDTRGESAYLCLSYGSTDWDNGAFIPRPLDELRGQAAWARSLLSPKYTTDARLLEKIELFSRRSNLGPAYEASTAFAFRYESGAIPTDIELKADVLYFAKLLGEVYRAASAAPPPVGIPPEVRELYDAAARAAGKEPSKGQGFRLSSVQRKAIEERAMELARIYLESLGWKRVVNTSRGNPYDFLCDGPQGELFVEVKGTTSMGDIVVLTRNEVDLHRQKCPNNALIVVSEITLTGDNFTNAGGGVLTYLAPWEIKDTDLTIVSYTYKRQRTESGVN